MACRMPIVNNNMYLEVGKLDYNYCQAIHQLEWKIIRKYVVLWALWLELVYNFFFCVTGKTCSYYLRVTETKGGRLFLLRVKFVTCGYQVSMIMGV